MPIYEDENGIRIESDQELNDAELLQAFQTLAPTKTPQQAGAQAFNNAKNPGLLDMAADTVTNAQPTSNYEPSKGTEYDRYLSYLSKGTNLATRPGPRQRMAEEESSFERNEAGGKKAADLTKDTGLAVGKGIIGVGEAMVGAVDITPVGMAYGLGAKLFDVQERYRSLGKMIEPVVRFKDAKKELDYMMSPDQQAINAEMETVKGFVNTIKFGLEHPSTILLAVAESTPSMIAGAGIGKGLISFFPKLQPYIAAAIGEGVISAGQTAEQTRQNVPGGNLDVSQKAVAFLSGALTTTLGLVGAGVAKKLNVFDIDTLLIGGGIKTAVNDEVKAAKRGIIRNALYSMVEEGIFQEWPQSMQEKMAQNVIEGRPVMDGVVEAGAQGILSGSAMGMFGGAGGYAKASRDNTIKPSNTVVNEFIKEPPQAGTLSQQFAGATPKNIEVTPQEDGRTVAMQDGQELGHIAPDGIIVVPDSIQGDERAEVIRNLLSVSENMAPDASQIEGATVVPQGQENANLAALIVDKAKAINETIGNTGSVDITPLVDLGRSIYESGANTLESFTARTKELLADVWEKVKDFVRQAWDVVSNERGEIKIGKNKPETLESYARKKRFNFNIPGHSNKEAIENGLFAFVKNDAVGIDKAAEELQSMGLLGATPDGHATAGDYLYDELKKIVVNRAKSKMQGLTEEEDRAIMEAREDLRNEGYSEQEINEFLEETDRDSQRQSSTEISDRENRLAQELLDEEDLFVSEEDASQQTTGETGSESTGSVQGQSENELSSAYNQAEAQATEELKQSPSFEEFERAVLGNANFGDTSMEDPLARGMTKAELRSLHAKRNMAQVDGQNTLTSLRERIVVLKTALSQAKTEARDLFYAGKRMGAFEAIEKMRAHQKELRESRRAEREFQNLSRWLDKIGKTIDKKTTIDPEHRKAVKMVLAHDAAELENWITASMQTGDQFQIVQEQLDLLRDNKWQSTEQVLEDARNQVSLIKQIIYQGRAARQIEAANKKFEFKEAIKDMVSEIRKAFNSPELSFSQDLDMNYFATPQKDVQSKRQSLKRFVTGMVSAMRKGEYIIQNLTAYEGNALFYRATYGRTVESERTRIGLDNMVNPLIKSAFSELREMYARGDWHKMETIDTPTGPVALERSKMIGIALNSGCEDNRRALREGTKEMKDDVPILSDEAIDAITDALTPAEKRFVAKVWGIFREQLPHLQQAYKQMFGEDMVTVDGVYYPMFFDRRLSGRIANAQADQDLFQTFGSAISVARGRTMTRVGGIEALDLDPLRFLGAVNETNQFIAYGESVRDVNRILSNKDIQRAVSDAIGDQYNDQLKSWLRRIANPAYEFKGDMAWLDNFMGALRDRTAVAILGWGLSTAATQWFAVFPSVHRLGMTNVLKGFMDFYRDYDTISQFCLDSSGWLSQRVGTMGDITLAEAMAARRNREGKLFAQEGTLGDLIEKSYFGLIGLTDKMITVPTWYSAYQVEFQKSQDHGKAVDFADMITRQTQSSTSAKDLATVQSGNNTRKAFVMFYSFFSAQYNEMARTVDLVKHGKIGMYGLMRSFWWTLMVPAVLQAIIKSRGWHDEDKEDLPIEIGKDVASELVGYGASSIPLAGGIVNSITSGFEFRPTPVVGVVSSSLKAGLSAKKAISSGRAFYGKNLPPWAREGGMATAYLFRLPGRQIMRTADEAYNAYRKGEVSWENLYGLVYKEKKDKKKK